MPGVEVEPILQFIRDTVQDRKVIIGVSGGVDSAVCLRLCAKAIGGKNVIALHMPMGNTPNGDGVLAGHECMNANVRMKVVYITPIADEVLTKMPGKVDTRTRGNLAARTRMLLLYTVANQQGGMVCGTGNRTEFFLGYTTKWGDNAADFYPILHLYKTEVWELAKELGVSDAIISRAPSAGLWPGQTDEGEIGMSYSEMDKEIYRYLHGTGEMHPLLLSRHLENQHKSEPGRSLLCSRW